MYYKIIVDSCCDLTPEMEQRFGITTVPINLQLGDDGYLDDAQLDTVEFMAAMRACTGKIGSASPSPAAFTDVYGQDSFVMTVTSAMSATQQSALLGAGEVPYNVHVFNSKTASAGQTLAAIKLYELAKSEISHKQIVDKMDSFIGQMKTYLVIERFDNLIKNGRLSKVKGTLANVLNMKLILGADGEGQIGLFGKVRRKTKMLQKLVSLVKEDGRPTEGANAVISHANNPNLAQQLADMLREKFSFKEIFVVPTRGTSSMYVDDQGIVLAF